MFNQKSDKNYIVLHSKVHCYCHATSKFTGSSPIDKHVYCMCMGSREINGKFSSKVEIELSDRILGKMTTFKYLSFFFFSKLVLFCQQQSTDGNLGDQCEFTLAPEGWFIVYCICIVVSYGGRINTSLHRLLHCGTSRKWTWGAVCSVELW